MSRARISATRCKCRWRAGWKADGLWKFGSVTNAATNGEPKRVIRRVVASKIRYAVLCYGVPLKIAPDPDLLELASTNLPPELQRNEAAVDSELAWLPLIEMKPAARRSVAELGLRRHQCGAVQSRPTAFCWSPGSTDRPPTSRSGLVDKALQAERDGLWGRAYFDARGLTQTRQITIWATNGFSARRKSAARWDLKPSWTTSRKRFPRVFR